MVRARGGERRASLVARGAPLVSSNGTNEIFKIRPDRMTAELFINTTRVGLQDVGNCVYDGQGHIWVHEIVGCRVWKFNLGGEPGKRNDPLETDPLKLNLPKICSMDYYGGCLFVPDWSDDLIVLER